MCITQINITGQLQHNDGESYSSPFNWENKLWEKEIESWMPHTSRAWILKCPLQSLVLLNVSQASEYPPCRSSCRQSAWPPLPPKRGHIHQRCIKNRRCCLDLFFKKLLYSSNNISTWLTNNELPVAACYEHGGFLLLWSLRLFGSHGFLWGGSEGDRQVAGVLGGSSRTGQSCGGCGEGHGGYLGGGTAALSILLRVSSFGNNVDHSLLVALHAGTKLKVEENVFRRMTMKMQNPLTWCMFHQTWMCVTSVGFEKSKAATCLTVNTKHSPVPKNARPSESCLFLSIKSVDRKAPKTWEMRNIDTSLWCKANPGN